MRLHNKIFFSFFIVALIPFYILLYYIYENNHAMIMKKNTLIQEKKFHTTALIVREDIQELEREIEFLASLSVMDDTVSDDLDNRILNVIHLKKKVFKLKTEMSVKNINGLCIASTSGCEIKDDSIVYKKKIFASFNKKRELGTLELVLPISSLSYYFKDEINKWSLKNKFLSSECIQSSIGYGLNLSMLVNNENLAKSFSILEIQLSLMALVSFITFFILFLFISKAIAKPISQNDKLQEEQLQIQSSQLILLEKAKELAQTKAHFISQMSHEFRTPLNSIIGFSQFLEQENLVDKEYEKLPKNIEKAGKHLLGMVNQILEYAKVQSEHIKLEIQNLNIRVLLQEVNDIVQNLNLKCNF